MHILLVHPGASTSTHDVLVGLASGLKARGHTLWDYNLDARIQRAGEWLMYCWKKAGKPPEKPTPSDILYTAGSELVTRALRVMPDVVLIVSAMYLHPDVLVLLNRTKLADRLTILFTESPYDDERQVRLLPYLRCAWTNERVSATNGVHYLPHAWNPDVHTTMTAVPLSTPAHDVVFVGTGFTERIELLSAVDWSGIDLALYGSWEQLGSRHRLRRYVKGGYLDNDKTALLYRKAKIGLNLYRRSKGFGKGAPRIAVAESLNPRAYELAALGCFTISDARAEVAEIFGSLVPTFDRPETLRALLDRWLADESGRAQVRAQLAHAVAAHTWHHRAAQLEDDLQRAGLGASLAASLPPEPVLQAVAGG